MFWKGHKIGGKSLIQLENENKQLQLNIMTLSDQLENFKRVCFKYQSEYNNLVKKVTAFCRAILDSEYARNQLGGNNPFEDMDVFTLIDLAEQHYRSKSNKERDLLIELTNKLKSKDQEIEGLKAQISRYMLKEQQMKESVLQEVTVPSVTEQQKQLASETDSSFKTSEPASTKECVKTSPVSAPKGIMRISIIEDDEDDDAVIKEQTSSDILPNKENDLKSVKTSSIISTAQNGEPKITAEEIEPKTETKKSSAIMAHVIDLKDYMDKMNDVMWDIVVAIGTDGLSESKDLKKAVVKDGITESAFNTALAQLRKMNIVEQERINTGWRWFHVYELSDLGNRLYVEKFNKDPVACEKQVLQREHTTALHGYCIKDAAYILQSVFGYDEAVTDRKINSIKLYNGEIYIPDIIAKKKRGAIVDYFEVELGHHTQKDFNNKLDKMRMVTKNLYFIVPDADTMNKILARQIGQWVLEKGGKEKLKGTTIYLTTMTKLTEGKWENIYPF